MDYCRAQGSSWSRGDFTAGCTCFMLRQKSATATEKSIRTATCQAIILGRLVFQVYVALPVLRFIVFLSHCYLTGSIADLSLQLVFPCSLALLCRYSLNSTCCWEGLLDVVVSEHPSFRHDFLNSVVAAYIFTLSTVQNSRTCIIYLILSLLLHLFAINSLVFLSVPCLHFLHCEPSSLDCQADSSNLNVFFTGFDTRSHKALVEQEITTSKCYSSFNRHRLTFSRMPSSDTLLLAETWSAFQTRSVNLLHKKCSLCQTRGAYLGFRFLLRFPKR